MIKRLFLLILSIVILSGFIGCARSGGLSEHSNYTPERPYESPNNSNIETADKPETVPEVPVSNPQPIENDNCIDRAFTRIALERGEELEGNTIFTYLYALAWQREYRHLSFELLNITENQSWYDYFNDHQAIEAAFAYAGKWTVSSDAAAQFKYMARFYKMLVDDCLIRFDEHNADKKTHTDENELYQTLNKVIYSKQLYDDYQSIVWDIYDDPNNPMPVYADLHDEGIYLAFAEPFGAVLTVNGEDYLLPWPGWFTPRAVLPRIYLSDFDEDGDDELAVIYYVDSGTGVSVEELYIVEFMSNMPKLAITIKGETIKEMLYYRIYAEYDPAADKIEIRLDDQSLRVDVSHIEKIHHNEFRGLDLLSIVQFDCDDGKLTVKIDIGLNGFDWFSSFSYVHLYADIVYHDNLGYFITLENCHIKPWSW